MRDLDAGTALLAGTAVATATGGLLTDANRTHLFNPAWPAHAKFHDGFTLGLAGGVGATALRLLLARPRRPGLAAALVAEVWAAQLAAYAFPGAAGVAHDFPDPATRPAPTRVPEWAVSGAMLGLVALGYGLERRAARGRDQGARPDSRVRQAGRDIVSA